MKLGISGMLPRDVPAITAEVVRAIREAGFSGAAVNFASLDPLTPAVCRDLRALLGDGGVELVEIGMYSSDLVNTDPAVRSRDIRALEAALKVAAALGGSTSHGPAVITGSGSLNPKGAWFPHPDNRNPVTTARLVASLKEAMKAAEDLGVILALECHAFTALGTPEIARGVLDAVGSSSLRVHLDPVNWITWDTIYRTGEAVRHMFEVLPPRYLLGAHAKGIEIEDRLAIHMNEVPAGAPTDRMDYVAYLQEMAKMPVDSYLVIEHTPLDIIPKSRDYIVAKAREAGVAFA
jgi:sugar phosphate isomerase/epimerase